MVPAISWVSDGFLGIGEKNVRRLLRRRDSTVDDSGNPRLVVNLTKDQLTDAPAFNSATAADPVPTNSN